MRKLLAVLAILATTAANGAMSDKAIDDEIKARCKAQWANQYQMQLYCIEGEREALEQLAVLVHRGGHVRRIAAQCLKQWAPSPKVTSYTMVVFCTEAELEAFEQLNN